jgi:hypothetical protein
LIFAEFSIVMVKSPSLWPKLAVPPAHRYWTLVHRQPGL